MFKGGARKSCKDGFDRRSVSGEDMASPPYSAIKAKNYIPALDLNKNQPFLESWLNVIKLGLGCLWIFCTLSLLVNCFSIFNGSLKHCGVPRFSNTLKQLRRL